MFLMNLYKRQLRRGGEQNQLKLQMTRQDIGNYLGLAFETVSRHLNHLQEEQLLTIENRKITLLDLAAIEAMGG